MGLFDTPSRFSSLGLGYYSPARPHALEKPYLIHSNQGLLRSLQFSHGSPPPTEQELLHSFTSAAPDFGLAAVYGGHQFGFYMPELGDGRAMLFAETQTQTGERLELQVKGAGMTPYSRSGDGRAVLRSSIREYLCSEAMHALGIPTTRALCLIGSQTPVYREQIETAALLVRSAPSHLRFGNFQYYYYQKKTDLSQQLADFVIKHYYPHLLEQDNPYAALLEEVVKRTARLIAQWQSVGFAHGVMNTDNMSILGLTLDYGPFAFLDQYQPDFICNHSDHEGRYAFNQQPDIGLWNCQTLAQSLLKLISKQQAFAALKLYEQVYAESFEEKLLAKLGLQHNNERNMLLAKRWLQLMADNQSDFSICFRGLCAFDEHAGQQVLRNDFMDRESFDAWARDYADALQQQQLPQQQRWMQMKQHNPKYILRNHLAQQAIASAEAGDFSEIHTLMEVLSKPYEEQENYSHYADYPPAWAQQLEISCSS